MLRTKVDEADTATIIKAAKDDLDATRTLGAVDELMKTLRYRAVVQAKAATEAGDKGLSGVDLKQYVERRLAVSFDEAGQACVRPDPSLTRSRRTFPDTPRPYRRAETRLGNPSGDVLVS